MENQLKLLESVYGSPEKAAAAIGYTERRFRDFRDGKAAVPTAVKLAIEKLLAEQPNKKSSGASRHHAEA